MISDPTDNDPRALSRRLIHDLRNHLNGMSMETQFLQQIVTNPDAANAVSQIENEMKRIQRTLRAYSVRLAPPQRERVPAIDVLTLWQTSISNLSLTHDCRWRCEVDSELIRIDLRMVADLLCELITAPGEPTVEAEAVTTDQGVAFKVLGRNPSTSPAFFIPGLDTVIAANGGTCQRTLDPDNGTCTYSCWFPIEAEDSKFDPSDAAR